MGLMASPVDTAIYPRSYLVVLNEYANYATVLDTASDTVVGDFETGLLINCAGLHCDRVGEMGAPLSDVRPQAEIADGHSASRQTSTDTSLTTNASGGSGLAAFTHTACAPY